MTRLRLARAAVLLLSISLIAACGAPQDEDPRPKPPGEGTGVLYMHTGTNYEKGLYRLSTEDGAATRIGSGIVFSSGTPDGGLASLGQADALVGSDSLELYEIPTDGAAPQVAASGCGANGLAYDSVNEHLYRIIGSNLYRSDPETCATLATIATSHALAGLAIDAVGQTLYGIGAADGNVYALDLSSGEPHTWVAVYDTGVSGWAGAGLAFDPDGEVLYAVGHPTDLPGLYRIDVAAQSMEHVGDTGVPRAYGGLAWHYEGEER
ncbi:MAG: hypothetical protein KF813_02165 [Trueperaceae bacterium]|nr:hypothetical protein [Trueperaceae bacterium]